MKKLEAELTAIINDEKTPSVVISFVLVFLSRLYGLGLHINRWLYRTGILKTVHVPCPVISIGNIAAGGTGKTPVTMYIADFFNSMGVLPTVLSRGYGGTCQKKGGVVGNGHEVLMRTDESGDEPFMMASVLKYPVLVGKDRVLSAFRAIRRYSPDVLILDDGFQHMRLHRNLNIMLLDCEKPLGNNRLIPAGFLRESSGEIKKRADLIIFTRCEVSGKCNRHVQELLCFDLPCFFTVHMPFLHSITRCREQKKDRNEKIINTSRRASSMVAGKTAILFSGIAKPRSFRDSAIKMGIIVKDHFEFADHHSYSEEEIRMIEDKAVKCQADLIVTTEKDYARLKRGVFGAVDMAVIGIRIEFLDGESHFNSLLKSVLTV